MASPLLAQVQLNSNTDVATAGYFQLSWRADLQTAPYVLQQSQSPSFSNPKTRYQGTDTATVLSGVPDGTYHFRVLDKTGTASNSISVEVKHHSLEKAFGFFTLGALMFVILIAVLITASRKEEKYESVSNQ